MFPSAEQRNSAFPSACWKLAPQELKINLAARLRGRLLLARVREAGFAFTHGLPWALCSLCCTAGDAELTVAGADVSFSAAVQVLWGWEGIHTLKMLPFFLIKKYINCAIGSCKKLVNLDLLAS